MIDVNGLSYWLYCKDCVAIVGVTCRVSSKRWVLRPNRCAHDVAGLVVMEDRNIIPLKKEVSRG